MIDLRSRNLSPRTLETYSLAVVQLTDFLKQRSHSLDVSEVTTTDLRNFIGHMLATRSDARKRNHDEHKTDYPEREFEKQVENPFPGFGTDYQFFELRPESFSEGDPVGMGDGGLQQLVGDLPLELSQPIASGNHANQDRDPHQSDQQTEPEREASDQKDEIKDPQRKRQQQIPDTLPSR